MSQLRVLFLGGTYAQIPIIKEARNRGFYLITCDYLPENPGHKLADEYHNVSTTDYEGVLVLARKVKADIIIAYASDPAAPVAAYVSEKLGLPGNSYESVQILSEKDLFRQFMKENGFNVPKIVRISSTINLKDQLKSLSFPYIVKPTDSSGSKGVSKVDEIGQIESAVNYAFRFSRNKRLIAEEFIESNNEQLHGDGFVLNGQLVFSLLGDHHYDFKVNPFVPYSTTWPSKKSNAIISLVNSDVNSLINKIGFKNGPINIEARVNTDGKIIIMELGPRSGGNFVPQVINYASGFDMVKASIDVLTGNAVVIPQKAVLKSAYYVIHTEVEGTLIHLSLSDVLKTYIQEFHQYVFPGEAVNSFQGANAAIGVIILKFSNRKEMEYIIANMENYIELEIKEARHAENGL